MGVIIQSRPFKTQLTSDRLCGNTDLRSKLCLCINTALCLFQIPYCHAQNNWGLRNGSPTVFNTSLLLENCWKTWNEPSIIMRMTVSLISCDDTHTHTHTRTHSTRTHILFTCLKVRMHGFFYLFSIYTHIYHSTPKLSLFLTHLHFTLWLSHVHKCIPNLVLHV